MKTWSSSSAWSHDKSAIAAEVEFPVRASWSDYILAFLGISGWGRVIYWETLRLTDKKISWVPQLWHWSFRQYSKVTRWSETYARILKCFSYSWFRGFLFCPFWWRHSFVGHNHDFIYLLNIFTKNWRSGIMQLEKTLSKIQRIVR